MEPTKKIAVYMDHFSASVIEYIDTAKEIKTITSEFNPEEREKILQKGESPLHHAENHLQLKYYKEITDAVAEYPQIILFGPTTAKTELQAILSHDNRFGGNEITIKITENLTHNEQLDFINNYFYISS